MEKIKTDTLILRKPRKSDIANLLPILNDYKVAEYVPNLFYQTKSEIKEFMKFYVKESDYKNDFCLLIQDLETTEILGIIDAYIYYNCGNTITISYALKSSARGKGIMPKALKLFLSYLYSNSKAICAEFSIREDNIASLKVMEKLNIFPVNKKGNYIYFSLSLQEKPSF